MEGITPNWKGWSVIPLAQGDPTSQGRAVWTVAADLPPPEEILSGANRDLLISKQPSRAEKQLLLQRQDTERRKAQRTAEQQKGETRPGGRPPTGSVFPSRWTGTGGRSASSRNASPPGGQRGSS